MKFTGHNLSQEEKQRRKYSSPDEKLLQKPVFTNYYSYRKLGDIKLSQYEIVLMTHKHSIGNFMPMKLSYGHALCFWSTLGQSIVGLYVEIFYVRTFFHRWVYLLAENMIWRQKKGV